MVVVCSTIDGKGSGPPDHIPSDLSWCQGNDIWLVRLTELLCKDSRNLDPARVINISSTASVEPRSEGLLSGPGNGTWSYQTSKTAVNQLTASLAVKLGLPHVTVNAILPGLFPSKMTPTGRYGATEDTAGLALFLASPASSHITGTHILLDSGARFNTTAIAPATKL
ncbi:hypothetical protein C8J56DRAFT_1057757 [Mycena floridula]|nr:hypothetical protein C8J56DRAFT_1057757 [Mycena floridula]